MLVFGQADCLNVIDRQFIVYNLSSSTECGMRLKYLMPPFPANTDSEYFLSADNDKNFDTFYNVYIFYNNQAAYYELGKIIFDLYSGFDVFVLIDRHEILDMITMSLMKIIQQHYGYNAYLINEASDVYCAGDSDFSINGLYNLDIDKKRWTQMAESNNISKPIMTGDVIERDSHE